MITNTTFTIVCHINNNLITIPEEQFTETQRAAIRYIISRVGKDPEPRASKSGTPAPAGFNRQGDKVARRAISIAQGYTGDPCPRCGAVKLRVSGHCFVCDECGETTGCS